MTPSELAALRRLVDQARRARLEQHEQDRQEARRLLGGKSARRACLECGRSLAGRGPRALTCSNACKLRRSKRAKREERLAELQARSCVVCGGPLVGRVRARALTCSRACTIRRANELADGRARAA